MLEVVEQLAGGTAKEEPQDDATATYAAKLTKSEGTDRLDAARRAAFTTSYAACSPGRWCPRGSDDHRYLLHRTRTNR